MEIRLIIILVIGLIWAALQTKKFYFFSWALLVMILSLPTGFRLMNFRYDYYALIVFIPIVITAAYAIGLVFERFDTKKGLATNLILLTGLTLSIFGAFQTQKVVNQETVLATKSDLVALNWIESHTPDEARFYINTVGWSGNNYRGVDGGGWIMPITGRWSVVPTIFYPMSGDEDFVHKTSNLGTRASSITECSEDFWSLVYDAGINYLYIKEGAGSLQPDALIACERVRQLTQIEDIHIYLVNNTGDTP